MQPHTNPHTAMAGSLYAQILKIMPACGTHICVRSVHRDIPYILSHRDFSYDHDTNLYPDYGHVSVVSTYAVSIAIFPSFKENWYAIAYKSVHGNGRIAV